MSSHKYTGKLPYVTWQKLKRDKVPIEQWPDYARRAYLRMRGMHTNIRMEPLRYPSNDEIKGGTSPAGDSAK